MFNKITDPINKKSYSIFSEQGKNLLKSYVKQFNGGAAETQCEQECKDKYPGLGVATLKRMECKQIRCGGPQFRPAAKIQNPEQYTSW